MSDVIRLVKWLYDWLRRKLLHPVTFLLGMTLGMILGFAIGVYASYAWTKEAAEDKVAERARILEARIQYRDDQLEACLRGLRATLPVAPVVPPEGEPATGRPVEATTPADEDGNVAEALAAIEEGQQLLETGYHSEALRRYLKAYGLLPRTVREQLDGPALRGAMELLETDLSEPLNVSQAATRFGRVLGEQRIIRLLKGMVRQ